MMNKSMNNYRGSTSSHPPVFSAHLEETSLVLSLPNVILPLMLDRPLWPVYPGLEDTWQHFLVDCSENFSNCVEEILTALTVVIR
jgi:hypothetical protein